MTPWPLLVVSKSLDAAIAAHIRVAMGESREATFELLDDIPLAPSGKHRTTLSLVPRGVP